MNKVKIIVDSTCDIPLSLLKENDVEMIPLKVSIGNTEYKDIIEINAKELFKKIENLDELPKTAAISPLEFENIFSKYVNDGYDVIFISLDSNISSTYI